MTSEKIILSFWNICLDNLPEGSFSQRRISPEEAKSAIDEARPEGRFLGVSQDDLLAPYKVRERQNHHQLCRVLKEQFNIELDTMRRYVREGRFPRTKVGKRFLIPAKAIEDFLHGNLGYSRRETEKSSE